MHAVIDKCQVCLRPATRCVQDVAAVGWSELPDGTAALHFERAGKHSFCGEHKRLPRQYNMAEIERAYDASRQTATPC